MRRVLDSGLTAVVLTQLSCAGALLTAPPGSSVTLSANPTFIPATDGVSVITALVIEPAGTLVPDGTVVLFFTNLGRIEPEGKTHNGVAKVNLLSDGRSGTANVTASSGAPAPVSSGGTATGTGGGSTTVTIGPIPKTVFISAVPSRITDSRSAQVFARVFDAAGNPLPNVAVIFSIAGPSPPASATEHLDSGGNPVFTDNNGQAEDVLRTQYPRDSPQKTVTVTATTSSGVAATTPVVITIN